MIDPFVATVKQWGNSKAFIIPHNVATYHNIEIGKKYRIKLEEIKKRIK